MPIIEIKMLEGRTHEQKKQLVYELTQAACRTIDTQADKVRVHIIEMPHDHYAIGGKLISEE